MKGKKKFKGEKEKKIPVGQIPANGHFFNKENLLSKEEKGN